MEITRGNRDRKRFKKQEAHEYEMNIEEIDSMRQIIIE